MSHDIRHVTGHFGSTKNEGVDAMSGVPFGSEDTSTAASRLFLRNSLVLCPINKFTDTLDFGDNRIGGGGPDERSPMFIVVGDILLDFVDQLADVAKRAAANRLLGYEPEPAFDLVEPA